MSAVSVSAAVAHACRILPKYWTRAAAMFTLLFILLQADRMVGQWARSLKELQNAQISLAADVRDLTHELAGHHAQDSIRSAYFAHATQIQQQRVRRYEGMASAELDSRPGSICEIQLLVPTAQRTSLGDDSYRYLGKTLQSLQSQLWTEEGFRRLCVLVVNMSPGNHPDFDRIRRDAIARAEAVRTAELPEICRRCKPGDRFDGGVALVGTTCRQFCSSGGFCGGGGIYREGGTDCGEGSADLAWVANTTNLPPRCRNCEPGNVADGGVPLGPGSICTEWCSAAGHCGRNGTAYSGKGAVDCGTKLRERLATTSRTKRRPAGGLIPVDFRFVEQLNFDDPYDKDHTKDATHNVASFHQARRQALHLSHALLEASRWRSEHVMVIEDDMPVCNASAFRHVARAITLVEAANRETGTGWSMIRVGFGGNGILMHWEDATTAGEYLISNMNRAPVDWLLPEWASSLTHPGSMVNQVRARHHFTYRLNLFRHIGGVSNFGDRKWSEGKDGLPVCFGFNDFLRREEIFLRYTCPHSMISPCPCQGGGFCPPTIYEQAFPINDEQRPRFEQRFAAYVAALGDGGNGNADATGTNADAELMNVTLYLSEVVLQFGSDPNTPTFLSIKNRVVADAQQQLAGAAAGAKAATGKKVPNLA